MYSEHSRSERLVKLVMTLLAATRPLSVDDIRARVEEYRAMDDDCDFARTFERDKRDVRDLGIVIASDDEKSSYRIIRDPALLPPIEFDPDERLALSLANETWQQDGLAANTTSALMKLEAAGIEIESSAVAKSKRTQRAFDACWYAIIHRKVLSFDYRGVSRRVQPWRLIMRNRHWYLLGFDESRDEPRIFKMIRMQSVPKHGGRDGAYTMPEGDVIDEYSERLDPPMDVDAVLAIRGSRAPSLRRRGEPCDSAIPLPDGYTAWRIPMAESIGAGVIAQWGPDVLVLEPAELRQDVIELLEEVAS